MMNLKVTIRCVKKLKLLGHCFREEPFRTRATAWVDDDKKISTEVDEDGDRCPNWNDETLWVPFDGPIKDDTTLWIEISDNPKDGTKVPLGSVKLKLKKVVTAVGYGALDERTLKLKRSSILSHGDVVVAVLIVQPGTAPPGTEQPDGQSSNNTGGFAGTAFQVLSASAAVASTIAGIMNP